MPSFPLSHSHRKRNPSKNTTNQEEPPPAPLSTQRNGRAITDARPGRPLRLPTTPLLRSRDALCKSATDKAILEGQGLELPRRLET